MPWLAARRARPWRTPISSAQRLLKNCCGKPDWFSLEVRRTVANSPQALEQAPALTQDLPEASGQAELQPLEQSLHLFRAFDAAGVRYCHYKSNQHLLPALAGDTDLDVLLDAGHAREAQVVLGATGYKRFDAKMAASNPLVLPKPQSIPARVWISRAICSIT